LVDFQLIWSLKLLSAWNLKCLFYRINVRLLQFMRIRELQRSKCSFQEAHEHNRDLHLCNQRNKDVQYHNQLQANCYRLVTKSNMLLVVHFLQYQSKFLWMVFRFLRNFICFILNLINRKIQQLLQFQSNPKLEQGYMI